MVGYVESAALSRNTKINNWNLGSKKGIEGQDKKKTLQFTLSTFRDVNSEGGMKRPETGSTWES